MPRDRFVGVVEGEALVELDHAFAAAAPRGHAEPAYSQAARLEMLVRGRVRCISRGGIVGTALSAFALCGYGDEPAA